MYGATPPLADMVWLYGTPITGAGTLPGDTVKALAAGKTVTVKVMAWLSSSHRIKLSDSAPSPLLI
ncbi:hypothetical protein D3C81_636010 [compost metagenome]